MEIHCNGALPSHQIVTKSIIKAFGLYWIRSRPTKMICLFVMIFEYYLGLSRSTWSFTQELLFPDEEIPVWLLESSGSAVIRFTPIGVICTSFLHWWKFYHRQTHVCPISPGHVSTILGSVFNPSNTGTYTHYDQGDGKYTHDHLKGFKNELSTNFKTCFVLFFHLFCIEYFIGIHICLLHSLLLRNVI